MQIGRFLEFHTERGDATAVGSRRIVPVARTVRLILSPFRGRPTIIYVRTSPIALEVTEPTGTRRIPIPNVRARTLAIVFLAALFLTMAVRDRQ